MNKWRKEIDYELLERLATIQCTDKEIIACLKVGTQLFYDRMKKDQKFIDAINNGREEGKMSLRRRQWDIAMNGGNAGIGMCIFLGKQYLGQRDKQETDVNVKEPSNWKELVNQINEKKKKKGEKAPENIVKLNKKIQSQ